MAAFIDEAINISHIKTFVFNAAIENVEEPAVCTDGSCISCFEIPFLEVLPVQVFLYQKSLKLFPDHTVSRNLNFEHSPAVSLEDVRQLDIEWSAKVSLCELDHLVLYRRSPDWLDIPSLVKDFQSRSAGSAKPSWLVAFSGTVGFGFDMALCFPIGSGRKWLKMATRKHRDIHDVEQTRKMIPFVTRKFSFG